MPRRDRATAFPSVGMPRRLLSKACLLILSTSLACTCPLNLRSCFVRSFSAPFALMSDAVVFPSSPASLALFKLILAVRNASVFASWAAIASVSLCPASSSS